MNPLVLALGGVVLFLAGLGLGYLMSRRAGDREAAEELAAVRQDFETYREGVTRHFRDSAGHFQAIGEQYRALYAHMADGAKNFCAGGPEQEAIEFAPQPELAAPDADSGRERLSAAAAAAALSEASREEPAADDVEDISDRREPVLVPDDDADKGEPAAAGEERDETADAETGESGMRASDEADSDEKKIQEQSGAEGIRDPERKETQAPGSGMVH
jgi:uncharacterized membrane-anchored protein YhcB (DUF1043 family)